MSTQRNNKNFLTILTNFIHLKKKNIKEYKIKVHNLYNFKKKKKISGLQPASVAVMRFGYRYLSITGLKFSIGCAPEINSPFTKNAGVPCTPYEDPSAKSASTSALISPESKHSLN